ncbi:hypothetical protein TMatcc_002788 [Talaromyces marneffei ATCC 18224]|uniref:MFS transporter, putative n=2 Tax=Talaromyces marneffei TaxID=37727 RepID=B6Q8A7_TALMQ|nr:uncharacterized protein EYB26_002124 [Talaromyces marneffei]EEA28859.1 MFS transporter, putative [Talaromyces marneffei ATCC 18224]QGA14470.1 hypothetical protein EYB26_002124 [Talaromyces marneffei]
MANSNLHRDPHPPTTESDSSSFSSNFVEVAPPSIEDSTLVPSNLSSMSPLHFAPGVSGNNTSESGMEQLSTSAANTSRPQPGSAELPRLQTHLCRDHADDIGSGDDDEGQSADEAQKFMNVTDTYDEEGYDSELEYKTRHRLRRQISMGAGANAEYTAEEEKEVVKRLDKRLVLFLAVLYMLSFLDRSNIGNAKIAGLSNDLKLSSSQYEWLLTAFYITYIAFEWMALMYKIVPAHIYIPLCVFAWGILACCQALTRGFWDLLIIRALLGVSEAAFGPGAPFYLSFFYKREELAYRTALFISAAPLATSFASSVAWAIVELSSKMPIAPWRSLFLIEGFPSLVAAVFAWLLIPDSPGKASFLTPRQRKVARLRLQSKNKIERHNSPSAASEKFNWKAVIETLCDPMSYLIAFMFFGCNVAFSSMPVFLPTIINNMGYSSITSQALSAPPFLVAFVVVLVTASLSDRSRTRSPYLIFHALISATAYLIIGLTGHFHSHIPTSVHTMIRYLCIYPATSGFFSAVTIIITWSMDNRTAQEGKGSSVAILNIVGQCGPLIGTRLYPDSDKPWFVRGMLTCATFMLVVAILAFSLRLVLLRKNRGIVGKREQMGIEMAEGEGLIDRGRDGSMQDEMFTYIV